MFKLDVLPSQRQNLIASAPGQHQQAEPCRRGSRDLALRLEFVEHRSQPDEFLLRQEALAASCRVLLDEPAGIAAVRSVARFRGLVEQARQQPDYLVRRGRLVAQPIVQRRDLLGRDLAETLPTELGQGDTCRRCVGTIARSSLCTAPPRARSCTVPPARRFSDRWRSRSPRPASLAFRLS